MLYNGKVTCMNRTLSTKVVAISLTLLLLLGIAFIIILYFLINPGSTQKYGFDGSPVTNAPVSFVLNVTSPDDNSLVNDPNVLLQGKTSPQATIIVSFDNKDQSVEVDKDGNFNATLKMDAGVNNFSITAFDNTGNSKTESRTLYYSKEKI